MTAEYDAAKTAPVERVARVLAGHALSRNAEGDLGSAGPAVDDLWPDYAPAALAVLRTLREPSGRMLAVGDAEIWDRMIIAAIERTWKMMVIRVSAIMIGKTGARARLALPDSSMAPSISIR